MHCAASAPAGDNEPYATHSFLAELHHRGRLLRIYSQNIVFFGEKLPKRVKKCLKTDVDRADLVLVLGHSLHEPQCAPRVEHPSPVP